MSSYQGNPIVFSDELAQAVLTVSTTAIELYTGASRNPRRQTVRAYNDGNKACYLGPSGVTSSGSTKGEILNAGESITYVLGDTGLYAITSTGSTSLIITELS